MVTLDVASSADAPLLENLLELYVHDMSEVFTEIDVGPDGRFGYPKLPLYWAEPDRRFAFVVRCDGKVAGFVLATLGSPVSSDPSTYDVAELFVLRRYRGAGVGRSAAAFLFRALPGKWTVRVAESNEKALPFWTRVVAEVSRGTAIESRSTSQPRAWRIFSFETAAIGS